ncbi:DDE superfamily endonuclease [Kutzneria buriramensis]|uniref:DDE superfamily endonuclease n=1 Tax=Kutzneria buriramensis TaxID=1045776 RepID=A0A3E0H1Q8_9PSEU|nr:DDE superfamily endonuclease [Kutzneria buriramensis]
MITYRATLDVPHDLARYLGHLLRAERRRRGTRTHARALTCFWQAVLGLRWFRHNTDVTTPARDHGIARATAYRYLDEIITVLADHAPNLHDALRHAKNQGATHVILDGKIFPADRYGEPALSKKHTVIDRWYSGKAHRHGGNIQALTAPNGFPLWVSDVEPGSVNDMLSARKHVLGALYWAASQLGLPTLADAGYVTAGIGVFTPVKHLGDGHALAVDNRTYDTLLRGLRCLGERGFALLTGRWRALRHITASPRKIGDIVKAAGSTHIPAPVLLQTIQCEDPGPSRTSVAPQGPPTTASKRPAMSSVAPKRRSPPGQTGREQCGRKCRSRRRP